MSSLYQWRRLREIERDFELNDPQLVAKFRTTAVLPTAWHRRTEVRILLVGLAILVTMLGLIGNSVPLIFLGLLIGAGVASLWALDFWLQRQRRRR
jgi:hypothetical protein